MSRPPTRPATVPVILLTLVLGTPPSPPRRQLPRARRSRVELRARRPAYCYLLLALAADFSEVIGTQTTCYQLTAYNGSTFVGRTQQLCMVPGVAASPAGALRGEQVTERLAVPLGR